MPDGGEPASTPALPHARDVLLVVLAMGAGAVDAITLTALGVFTAAITGNLVLVGLALGSGNGGQALRAGAAFAAFALGLVLAGRVLGEAGGEPALRSRAREVIVAVALVQAAFAIAWIALDGAPHGAERVALIAAAALAMGAQTEAVRTWHARGITTTYVTGTLTLLVNELLEHADTRRDRLRRGGVIAGVVAGATLGSLLLDHAHGAAPLLPLALSLVVAVALPAARRRAHTGHVG
ncbi:MAG TPA: DUF1275 family protein [Conexibacter sp.]|jgi:uncharacterized membrane protein YoaK (UPF0700 family)|nr:DUF1275 family protein [Conexibacter sp.]